LILTYDCISFFLSLPLPSSSSPVGDLTISVLSRCSLIIQFPIPFFILLSLGDLLQRLAELEQAVDDSHYILPPRHLEPVKRSSVLILDSRKTPAGVGFFVSSNIVVTANHNLTSYVNTTSIDVKLFSSSGRLVSAKLTVKLRHADLDLAVLTFAGTGHGHLSIIRGVNNIGEQRLAVTSFSIAMSQQLPDITFEGDGFILVPAQMLRTSPHHIVYHSNLFSGDSGGAVVFSKAGEVVALHLQTVNEAHEELDHNSYTLDDVANSINSIVRGFSQGFIGLRLDPADVQALIFN
jgi:tetrahydromethanopterin S-methyltransferase subunit B